MAQRDKRQGWSSDCRVTKLYDPGTTLYEPEPYRASRAQDHSRFRAGKTINHLGDGLIHE